MQREFRKTPHSATNCPSVNSSSSSGDYLEAVDAAFAYLDEHDPNRTGAVSGVEIHRIRDDDARETVWRYGHSEIRPPEDLTAHWGFDVTQAWFRRDAAA